MSGARLPRAEDPRLLVGGGRYLADVVVPGTAHAAFVRSPHPHASVVAVDASAALELPGVHAVLTNKTPVSAYRGAGWTASHSARETLIDEAARLLGRDPANLRRQNLVRDFPYTSATDMLYDSGSFAESLDHAAELTGYADARRRALYRWEIRSE